MLSKLTKYVTSSFRPHQNKMYLPPVSYTGQYKLILKKCRKIRKGIGNTTVILTIVALPLFNLFESGDVKTILQQGEIYTLYASVHVYFYGNNKN